MTTTTSEDSSSTTAPRIFYLSSSADSPNVQKCPLCFKFRKSFYCNDCIHSGYIHSSKSQEGYINLHKALLELQENKLNLEKKCVRYLESKQKSDALHTKIRQGRDRVSILKLALEEKRQKRILYTEKLAELKHRNYERSEKIKAYKRKSEQLGQWVISKCEDVTSAEMKLQEKQEEVKKLVRLRVEQLFKYVFPINEVKPDIIEMESSTDDMVQELAEASQTTFISDRWIYSDDSNGIKHSIVAPRLPGSGNYSSYLIGMAQNRDAGPSTSASVPIEHNPAFEISAALTYTAQLVNVLSFLLNIRLPHKMLYSDFCNTDMNEKQFARRVGRLNSNILYLCISQNIDLSCLSAKGTLHNVMQIRDNENADLGSDRESLIIILHGLPKPETIQKDAFLLENLFGILDQQRALLQEDLPAVKHEQGPIEVASIHLDKLENAGDSEDLKPSEDSDSDEGDSFTVEWEAVPHVQCPEVSAGPATVQSSQMINTQQASSMAGGLMNSVASIWRGFTGR